MAAADYFDTVQKIYIAFYSRPADPVGLSYWADVLNTNGGNLAGMIDSFATSSEATALYEGQGTNTKINSIYNALFGRDGDVEGITFYANEISAGRMTIGAVGINILNGAQAGVDLDAVNAKVDYCTSFTAAIDTADELVGYEGTTAASTARTELNAVVDAATLATATANIDATLTTIAENPPGVAGSTFTLSTSADTLNPTSTGTSQTTTGDDTITGGSGRLGSDDSVDGGAGNDILNITVATGAAPIIQNVETVNVTTRGNATALDFTDITGVTTLNVSGTQSATLGGFAASGTITVNSGFANNLNLALSDATGTADAITVVGDGASAFTLALTAIETLNLRADTDLTLGKTANVGQLSFGSAVREVDVTGTGNVTLFFGTAAGAGFASGISALSAIKASGLAGSLTLDWAVTNQISVEGGAGNDTFNFYSSLDTLDTVNGNGGSDTVRASIAAGLSTVRPTLTNIETLTLDSVKSAATLDLRNATGIETLNIKNATALTVQQIGTALATINLQSGATDVSNSFSWASKANTVTVNFGHGGCGSRGVSAEFHRQYGVVDHQFDRDQRQLDFGARRFGRQRDQFQCFQDPRG